MRRRSRPLRPLEQLLVESALGHGSGFEPPLGAIPIVEVVGAADHHRIAPAVFRRIRAEPDAPADWRAALGARRHEQMMRHLRAIEDLKVVGSALDAVGIPWAVAKGPHLAERIWPSPDMRQYTDLDIFVDRRVFARAMGVLGDAGVDLVDRNWPLLASTMRAEVAMVGRFGSPIDLHWDIAVPRALRRSFPTDIEGMLARAIETDIGSVRARVFDPIDVVVHLAFHAAQAGANRLVWLSDIRHAVGQPDFDWSELAIRVRRARFEVPAAMVIARVDRTIGFDRPPTALVLRPASGGWGRLTRLQERQHPGVGLPTDEHLAGTMYSSARRHVMPSILASARAWVEVRRHEAKHRSDPAAPRELRRNVPDDAARRDYLRATEHATDP